MSNYTVAHDETTPLGTESKSYGDNRIRELKVSIRERLSTEHDDITGSSGDALLRHKGGECTVMLVGTTAEIAAVTPTSTSASECPVAYDTTLKCHKYWNGTAWQVATLSWDNVWNDPVHSHATDAEGGLVSSSMKFMATPVNKVSWTAATDWTDVDISANTGTDIAKAALLAVELSFTNPSGGSLESKEVGLFRKNGSSEATVLSRIGASCYSTAAGQADSAYISGNIIVECDTSEIFEVKLSETGATPASIVFKVDLIGYFV